MIFVHFLQINKTKKTTTSTNKTVSVLYVPRTTTQANANPFVCICFSVFAQSGFRTYDNVFVYFLSQNLIKEYWPIV